MKNIPLEKSPFARCLPRLLGGLAECIVVVMLVALACVIAVFVFGKTIAAMRDVTGKGASTQHVEEKSDRQNDTQ